MEPRKRRSVPCKTEPAIKKRMPTLSQGTWRGLRTMEGHEELQQAARGCKQQRSGAGRLCTAVHVVDSDRAGPYRPR